MSRWLVVLCACSSSPPHHRPAPIVTPDAALDAALDAAPPDAAPIVRDRPWTPARQIDDTWDRCPDAIAKRYKKSTKIEAGYSLELACLAGAFGPATTALRLRSRPKSPQSHDGGWEQLVLVDTAGEEHARSERSGWGWLAGAPGLKVLADLDGDDIEDFIFEQGSTDWFRVIVLGKVGAKLEKILSVPDITPVIGPDDKRGDEPPPCVLDIAIVDEQPTNARMLVLSASPGDMPRGCDNVKGAWHYTWRDGKLVLARSDR